MSFREMSAWVMAAVMVAIGVYYINAYLAASGALGGAVPPFGAFIPYTVFAVTAAIVAQVVLAVIEPKDAEREPDERERPLLWRAGHWAGLLQGALCIAALQYVVHNDDLAILFHLMVGSLIISQLFEYVLQILFLRRSA